MIQRVMHGWKQQCGKYLVCLHENNLLFWVNDERKGILPSAAFSNVTLGVNKKNGSTVLDFKIFDSSMMQK